MQSLFLRVQANALGQIPRCLFLEAELSVMYLFL